MTFTVIDCEQRTAAWRAARAGLLTATDAAAMLSTRGRRPGEEPTGKTELRLRLALEGVRGTPVEEDHYESDYMRRGRAREADGVALYEVLTGEIVQPVGFLRSTTLPIGCSPDGIVGDFEGGLELKAPKFTTHWGYLRAGTLPAEYAAQVTHSLFVTQLPFWDFCSYCPEFDGEARLFRRRVFHDDVDLEAYGLALQFFLDEVELVKQSLREVGLAPELVHD